MARASRAAAAAVMASGAMPEIGCSPLRRRVARLSTSGSGLTVVSALLRKVVLMLVEAEGEHARLRPSLQ